MRVSTRVEYGVLALADIALSSDGGNSVSAQEISNRQGISKKYLEQILPLLKQAGLIKAHKGLGGGYYLSCNAEEVKISDVLNALDNSILEEMDYTQGEDTDELSRALNRCLWGRMNAFLIGFAQNLTLSGLIRNCRDEMTDSWDMYVI